MMTSATGVQTVVADFETQASSNAVDLQTIAHELRQPLSAIESIAYYLNLALPRDSRPARKQARRLQHLVEQSNWILTSALQLADHALRVGLDRLHRQPDRASALFGVVALRQ